jgi:ABC-type protease/lipase transport system fused ATPase/permease subunit
MKPRDAMARVRIELRRPLVAVGIFGLVINLLSLTVPIYMSQVYDRVLTSYSIETLVMLTVIALALLALLVALDDVRYRLLMQSALKVEQTLGPALLAASVKPAGVVVFRRAFGAVLCARDLPHPLVLGACRALRRAWNVRVRRVEPGHDGTACGES